jgi:hypothetical protein
MVNRAVKIKRKTGAMTVDTVLWSDVRDLILEARRTVVRGVNAALVWTNFEIGRRIVEYEQKGKSRAEYAEETLKSLSQKLTAEFGKGYSVDNLQRMRAFYIMYQKYATVSRISEKQITQTESGKSGEDTADTFNEIVQTVPAQFSSASKSATPLRICPQISAIFTNQGGVEGSVR